MPAQSHNNFTLDGVYPWGRSLDEYVAMFSLADEDLRKRILSCADGPAAFNATLTRTGGRVTSVDPLYRFSGAEIRARVESTYEVMLDLTRRESHRFVWNHVATPEALGQLRLRAMTDFLADYDQGLTEDRYLNHALPSLPFADDSFDLALCSHFLFLYSEQFDAAFHTAAVLEMSRLALDVRIFPLLDMTGRPSAHLEPVIRSMRSHGLTAKIVPVPFEFQRGGNQMLQITRSPS